MFTKLNPCGKQSNEANRCEGHRTQKHIPSTGMNYYTQSDLSIPFIAMPIGDDPENRSPPCAGKPHDEQPSAPKPCGHKDMISFALFFLLFVQFGLFYAADDPQGLQWSTVNVSICLFIAATFFYRMALTEIGLPDDIALICAAGCVVTALFFGPTYAFLLLLVGKLSFVLVGVVVNVDGDIDDEDEDVDVDVTFTDDESQESMA